MTATAQEIKRDLMQYYGTDQYYRLTIRKNLLFTEGAKAVADRCGAYWLMDIIASYQGKELEQKTEGFQVWTLAVSGTFGVVICDDGNKNTVVRQDIPYTDFPLDSIKLYCCDGVVMLPTEY